MTEERAKGREERNEPDNRGAGDIAIIREQTRESLELLRSLVRLMLPREGAGEGRQLDELIAVLIAQQREILTGIGLVQADMATLFERLGLEPKPKSNGQGGMHSVTRR